MNIALVKRLISIFFISILIIFTPILFFKLHLINNKPKYIIMVLADSLRPDHMGCYGYDKITTPFIDEKSKEALVFKSAFTTGSWTRSAIPSLFTGLYVFQHKISRFDKEETIDENKGNFKKKIFIYEALPDNILTFVEILKNYGYKCYALYNFEIIDDFMQKFDKYINVGEDKFIKIFKKLFNDNKNENIFFYLHFISPHSPYINFYEISEEFESLNKKNIKNYPYDIKIPFPYSEEEAFKMYKNVGECMLGYDKEIFWVDKQFKKLWNFLEEEKVLKNSLIIFLADHGEEFAEYGGMSHSGHRLFDEIIHIPLIIWSFKYKGSNHVDRVVSIIDLFPTILASIGYDINKLKKDFKYFGINLLKINRIPENRGVIAEVPRIDAEGNFHDLGLIIYRTKNKKIYLDGDEKNMSYYKVINNKEIKCENENEFQNEKISFLNILQKVRYSYIKGIKPNIKKSTIVSRSLDRLKSLGYLH